MNKQTSNARNSAGRASKATKTKDSPKIIAPTPAPTTKSARVLALLASDRGTTIAEIAAATGWQNHSVRGFLAGTVKKKLGRELVSVTADGTRRYRIAG